MKDMTSIRQLNLLCNDSNFCFFVLCDGHSFTLKLLEGIRNFDSVTIKAYAFKPFVLA